MTDDRAELTEEVKHTSAPIAREHLLGATVWAYGGGGVDIKPWTSSRRVKMPARLDR